MTSYDRNSYKTFVTRKVGYLHNLNTEGEDFELLGQ